MLEQIRSNFDNNLDRVRNLVDLYSDKLAGPGQGRRPVNSTDVLRAGTVLLHATLEEFLRGVSRWKLPQADEEALNQIPLVGLDRPIKFFLGKLALHRGRTIDEVISDSINLHLSRSSFNNTSDIAGLLQSISLDEDRVKHLYPRLSELINRRHHIVHRADLDERPGRGHHRTKSIGTKTMRIWIDTVVEFAAIVCNQLDRREPDG